MSIVLQNVSYKFWNDMQYNNLLYIQMAILYYLSLQSSEACNRESAVEE